MEYYITAVFKRAKISFFVMGVTLRTMGERLLIPCSFIVASTAGERTRSLKRDRS